MEAYFDGVKAFQSPDMDIVVMQDNRPVLHITYDKLLTKQALIKTVRQIREMVFADRMARENGMKTYDVVCPICGKLNKGIYLEETEGSMECDSCGNVVDVLEMENGTALPILSKELCRAMLAHTV